MSSPAVLPAGRRRGRPGYDLASVLAVAVELFNEKGYEGTSMRDLAARLGIATIPSPLRSIVLYTGRSVSNIGRR